MDSHHSDDHNSKLDGDDLDDDVAALPRFPEPFYSHCNPDNQQALAGLELRRQEFYFWNGLIDTNYGDVDELFTGLVADTGLSPYRVEQLVHAFVRMRELPKLYELATRMWHIDLERWISIDRAMDKAGDVDASLYRHIDAMLVKYLYPKKPGQVMPTKNAIARRISKEIEALDSTVTDKPRQADRKDFEHFDILISQRSGDNARSFRFDTDVATSATIDARIRAHAKDTGLSMRDATVELLLGASGPKVSLQCYRASDIPGAPVFVSTDTATATGAGYEVVFGKQAEDLASQATKIVDVDDALTFQVASYVATSAMRAAVVGRDGTCRYPGCSKPVATSQLDHVIEYDEGGPTTPANLVALCQHHHNIKTDRRVRPIFEPASGTVVWLFADGSWSSTEPNGPLANSQRKWVRTVADQVARYRQERREQAQADKIRKEKHDADRMAKMREHDTRRKTEQAQDPAHNGKPSRKTYFGVDVGAGAGSGFGAVSGPIIDPFEAAQESTHRQYRNEKQKTWLEALGPEGVDDHIADKEKAAGRTTDSVSGEPPF